jgi:tagatose-1,6-bisphosphate aldolase non-catalytic subunit AgaZ/GatZ
MRRHFSNLDRIRDYSPDPAVETAVRALRSRLVARRIPAPLIGQYLPALSGGEGEGFDDGFQQVTQKKHGDRKNHI